MSPDLIVEILTDALLLAVVVALPPLLAAWVVGVATGVLQAVTVVSDPVIGFVPRLAAACVAMLVAGPWMLQQTVDFGARLMAVLVAVQVS